MNSYKGTISVEMVRWRLVSWLWLLLTVACAVGQQQAVSQTPSTAAPGVQSEANPGNAGAQSPGEPAADVVEAAIEQFRTATRERGLRSDSTKAFQAGGGRLPQYHGRLTYNIRNDLFDAIPHQIRQRGGQQSILRRHQFGFNVSGPVFIPKLYNGGTRTFFTLSYEGVRESIARSLLETLPIQPERVGDFSQTVDPSGAPLPIYDPASTSLNPAFNASLPVRTDNLQYQRSPFVNNRIPVARLDPVALRTMSFFPVPNTNVGPFFRNNFFVVSPERNVVDGFTGRVDHIFNDRHRANLNLTITDAFVGAAKWFDNAANPGPMDRIETSNSGSLQHIFTISPETIHSTTFDFSSSGFENQVDQETNYPAQLGIPGKLGSVFPAFNILDGYLDIGRANLIRRNYRHTYTLTNTYSTRLRGHNLRFSGRATQFQLNSFQPDYPSGRFRFQNAFTALPGIVNTGHGFATFLLGEADFAELSVVDQPSYWRRWYFSGRIVDQVELRRGLNLTFDVNLEHSKPRVEKFDRHSTVDLSAPNPEVGLPGGLVFARQGDNGRTFQRPITVLEPRVSLAWNPNAESGSVVRLNYARSYSAWPLAYGHWGSQGFNLYPTVISPNRLTTPAVLLRDGFGQSVAQAPNLSPSAANNTQAELQSRTNDVPMTVSYGLSYEREMPGNLLVVLGVSRDSARNLFVNEATFDPNAVPLDFLSFRDLLNDESFLRNLRPFPQYQRFSLNSMWPAGRYNRDEASVRVEKRATGGLTVRATYRFSKQMDNYSGPGAIQDKYNLNKEWAVASFNSPHVASLNYVYELPFGPNKDYFTFSDWRRYLIAGWSFTGTSTLVSGRPLSMRAAFNNTGSVVQTLYVNVVDGVSANLEDRSPELWYNPAAFSHPDDFTIGNAPRNMPNLFGPARQNHDLSVSKRFPLTSGQSLEFTAVGLNFMNIGNLDDPDTEIGTVRAPNANAGRILQSVGGRIIQLGLRLNF
ncbi:MAG: hypothetical protein MUF01_01650 [Bryobacterales bacterium]|nr:hypothetical protein [Bryobacterales bacterium]